MGDLVSALFLVVAGGALCAMALRFFPSHLRQLLVLSYMAHVGAAVANVLIIVYVYRGGDMMAYARNGELLSKAIGYSLTSVGPEAVKLLLQFDARLPMEIRGSGHSTGSMSALAGLVYFATGGGLYATNIFISLPSYLSKLLVLQVVYPVFPAAYRLRIAAAFMLIPSVVFWSSGLMKESVAMVGLGLAAFALPGISRRELGKLVWFGLGCVIIGLFKAYILFALACASGAFLYVNRATDSGRTTLHVRPGSRIVGLMVAIGGIVLLGRVFPKFAIENLADQAAYLQEAGQRNRGGSTYIMGDGSTTLAGQLAFAPWALVSSLFRPFPFEVRNPQMLINSLETTLFLYLTIRTLIKNGWRWLLGAITSSPWLAFSVVFTVTFGVAVGLATTNLGTLSRYRAPLVPFLALIVFTTTARRQTASAASRDRLSIHGLTTQEH